MSSFRQLMMRSKGGGSPIPAQYEVKDWLYSNDGNPYIKTGIIPTNMTKVDITIKPISYGNACPIGSDISWRSSRSYNCGNNVVFGSQYKQEVWQWLSAVPLNKISNIKMGQDGWFVNDVQKETFVQETFTGIELYLFRWNRNGSVNDKYQGWMYSCKIYSDYTDVNSLVRDYVPVYDTVSQKYGMFDVVSQTFFGSENSYNFEGGND